MWSAWFDRTAGDGTGGLIGGRMVRGRGATLVVVAALALAGCGGSPRGDARATSSPAFADLTGRQVGREAATELAKVSSLHLQGSDRYEGDAADLDLSVDEDGTCVGSFHVPTSSFQVIHARDGRWLFQGNAGYWKRFAPRSRREAAVARYANRWLLVSGEDLSSDLTDLCDLEEVRRHVVPEDTDECVEAQGGPATEEPTVQVWCGTTHVWVRAEAPHRPVRYETRDGQAKVTLSDFGDPVEYGLPGSDEILDVTGDEHV